MNIEQEIIEIKTLLKTLLEQTAPPPSIKTKMKMDARINQVFADRAERKNKRENGRKA